MGLLLYSGHSNAPEEEEDRTKNLYLLRLFLRLLGRRISSGCCRDY